MTDLPVKERLGAALADRYRIERELGQGGMATVFLAEDLKHDRKVAIKVLKPELAAVLGAERFVVEIKTTAALSHPHILPLFDSGEAGGFLYYVMPFIEGETIRDRLNRETQLSVDEAVRITREIADALDYAHRHGVIHRDIKPENLLLHDGRAMVMDFGIALAVSAAAGGRMTETGLSLGTPHYMSPEQATADKAITGRSDIYSLASVCYEMLAGDPPHTASSAQAIIMKIVTEEAPPVTARRKAVPEHVAAALAQALEKLPADRFATAAEFSAALGGNGMTRSITRATAVAGPLGISPRGSWAIAAGSIAIAVGAVGYALASGTAEQAPRVVRFELTSRDIQQLVSPGGTRFAWAPDGSEYVYTGTGGATTLLWSRKLNAIEPVQVRGTEHATSPAFSPDGRYIAFITVAPFSVRVVPRSGGQTRELVSDRIAAGGGVTWSDDGFLYYDAGPGLARVNPEGGDYEMVLPLDSADRESGLAWPRALPNGRGILMRVRRANEAMSDWSIVVLDLRDRSRKTLAQGVFGLYSPETEHLLWVTADGTLMGQRFDVKRLELRGEPLRLLDGLSLGGFGAVDLALSTSGDLLYTPGVSSNTTGLLSWMDRRGASVVADSTSIDGLVRSMSLSPDGSAVAFAMERPTDVTGLSRIWVTSMGGGPLQLVTTESRSARNPVWSADGRSIYYTSDEGTTIYRRRADGSGNQDTLAVVPRGVVGMTAHPSGGSIVLVGEDSGDRRRELLDLQLTGDRTLTNLGIPAGVNNETPALSPDGRWLAYVSPLTGRDEVYVSPYPNVGSSRVQISGEGGGAPRWNPSGGELFYVNDAGAIVSVRFTTTSGFRAVSTTPLFSPQSRGGEGRMMYAPDSEGRRFLMIDIAADRSGAGVSRPVVVQNFTAELKARVPR